jgi:hypothetical protein
MNKKFLFAISFVIILMFCLIYILDSKQQIENSKQKKENLNLFSSIKSTEEYIKINKNTYNYILPEDGKLHLTLNNDIVDNYNVFLDFMVINVSEDDWNDTKNGYKTLNTWYLIKPVKHEMILNKQKFIVNVIYKFDIDKHFYDLNRTWKYKKDFVFKSKDGILLKNTSQNYRFFQFDRKYKSNVSCTFNLKWNKFIPGTSIYFGKTIYFVFNNKSIYVMRKIVNSKTDKIIQKVNIDKIVENQIYKIEAKRIGIDGYKIFINNKEILTYEDIYDKDNMFEKYRSVGIAIPKNGSEILIKSIEIKE